MKIRILSALVLLLIGAAHEAAASGGRRHHGHHGGWGGPRTSFGLYFGAPLFWGPDPFYRPYYRRPYYPDYYYAPRTVIIEREPPVYIQRAPAAPSAPQVAQTWYYCPNPAGYYPYVSNCSQQWVPVDPRSVPPAPATPPG